MTLFGIDQLPQGDEPASDADLHIGRADLRKTLTETLQRESGNPTPVAVQLAQLKMHQLLKDIAKKTLRQTVSGESPRLHLWNSRQHGLYVQPEASELPHLETPTTEELKEHGHIYPLQHPNQEEIQKIAGDPAHTHYARLQELQKLAMELVEEDISDVNQWLGEAVTAVRNGQLNLATESLSDVLLAMGNCLHVMNTQTVTRLHSPSENAHFLRDLLDELLSAKIETAMGEMDDPQERNQFVARLKGMFDQFFEKDKPQGRAQ